MRLPVIILLLGAAYICGETLTPAERIQRLRVEFEEMKIVNTGKGYYERDVKRYMREVGNLDLIGEMVRDCPAAADYICTAERLKRKRWIPWFGQGTILLGLFDTGKDGTFSSVLFAVSGISWAATTVFDRKILSQMDLAVEAYNQWLAAELGLGGDGG